VTTDERLEVIAACAIVPLALALLPGNRVLRAIRSIPARQRSSAKPAGLARAVDRVLHSLPWIWRHSCLRRATTLAALLRRHGLAAEVVIGVRRSRQGALEAHAWLACGGVEPYLEGSDITRFSPLRRESRAVS
jgi:hypothetical protein